VQDLEDEIGVDLLRRSPRGVTLTAEGKLFLEEVRELLKHADEAVEKVRALARGEYGELHVGYVCQVRQQRYCRQRWQRFERPCQA
jgi:DNA-binding transcriptional LysR family regulator